MVCIVLSFIFDIIKNEKDLLLYSYFLLAQVFIVHLGMILLMSIVKKNLKDLKICESNVTVDV